MAEITLQQLEAGITTANAVSDSRTHRQAQSIAQVIGDAVYRYVKGSANDWPDAVARAVACSAQEGGYTDEARDRAHVAEMVRRELNKH